MGRWIKPETKIKLRKLIEEGLPRMRIIARLGITDAQFQSQRRIMKLHAKRDPWGMVKTYRKLQGGKK